MVAEWKPLTGLTTTLSYTFNDQVYTRYTEQLSAGSQSTAFDRTGNKIPGVEKHNVSARLAYDQPSGSMAGVGGFIEVNFRDRFYVDNANSVKAPDYTLLNLNVHYAFAMSEGYAKSVRLFLEVQNFMDRRYVASANNVSNSISSTTGQLNPASAVLAATGSVYAGPPRNIIGGLKVGF